MAFVILNEVREHDVALHRSLDSFNERCEIFRDEREFLQRLGGGNVRAVIVVIYSESLDGLLVIEKVRKIHGMEQIPVVAISVIKHPLPFIDAYERGADEYFTFPLNEQEFAQKMRKALKM
ncbi:MAG: response regulator [Spirochaetes bacterium]|nr:response regulator [Spirochaetota bacterium]